MACEARKGAFYGFLAEPMTTLSDAQIVPAGGAIAQNTQASLWRPAAPVRLLEALQQLATDGVVLAPQKVIAAESDLSVRQLRRLLEVFEAQGFLIRMRRGYQLSKRPSMAAADTDGRSGHRWPQRTPMAAADISPSENKGFPAAKNPVHKEQRARVAVAAVGKELKKVNTTATAAPPEVFRCLRKIDPRASAGAALRIWHHCRERAPDITADEAVELLKRQASGFSPNVRSPTAVLISWSYELFFDEELKQLREERQQERDRERQRLESEKREQNNREERERQHREFQLRQAEVAAEAERQREESLAAKEQEALDRQEKAELWVQNWRRGSPGASYPPWREIPGELWREVRQILAQRKCN